MQHLKQIMIVLGHRNDTNGKLSPIALQRCDRAYQVWAQHPSFNIICTGGFGKRFNPTQTSHAELLKNQINRLGVPSDRFSAPALSRFTLEDATCSKAVLADREPTQLFLVTSDFHMPRASFIFAQVFPHTQIIKAAAHTDLDKHRLQKLYQHEEVALARDSACFE